MSISRSLLVVALVAVMFNPYQLYGMLNPFDIRYPVGPNSEQIIEDLANVLKANKDDSEACKALIRKSIAEHGFDTAIYLIKQAVKHSNIEIILYIVNPSKGIELIGPNIEEVIEVYANFLKDKKEDPLVVLAWIEVLLEKYGHVLSVCLIKEVLKHVNMSIVDIIDSDKRTVLNIAYALRHRDNPKINQEVYQNCIKTILSVAGDDVGALVRATDGTDYDGPNNDLLVYWAKQGYGVAYYEFLADVNCHFITHIDHHGRKK